MPKFKIAENPTFKAEVEIPRVGGVTVKVPFVFKYRNRAELAELFDDWREKRLAFADRFKGEDISLTEFTNAEMELQVGQIQDLVVGWGFDDEFNEESIAELVKTCVGAPDAVVKAYSDAFNHARLGN